VRNKHLAELLAEKGRDDEETWSSITLNEGSVQHLDFLSQDEKDVFKTAFELDQRWVVELGGDRASFVCQSQSVNVFLPADVQKRDLHQIHFLAWKKGLKSLYYCRSKSIQRAEAGDGRRQPAVPANGIPLLGKINGADRANGSVDHGSAANGSAANGSAGKEPIDYDECLACQ
jgi:ribonucleoside-diphosphate reductase alpha chain